MTLPTRRSLRLQGLQPTSFNLAEYILRIGILHVGAWGEESEEEEDETDGEEEEEELHVGLLLQERAHLLTAVDRSILDNEGSVAAAA
jgi:hypothetical protein